MRLRWPAALLGLLAASLMPSVSARADDPPGQFDFYVLALSWSPSYCATPKASPQQCQGPTAHRFVVHGLWPQNERGYPQDCVRPAPFVPDSTISGMADLMPSKGLVLHEWRKHGTCTGLPPDSYFDLVRKARARVTVPPEFQQASPPARMTSADIEAAFVKANPGLGTDMMAVSCASGAFSEIRICLGKDLAFRSCGEVDRKACGASRSLVIPPPK